MLNQTKQKPGFALIDPPQTARILPKSAPIRFNPL